MKNIIYTVLSLLLANSVIAQAVTMGGPGFPATSPMDCNIYSDNSITNFFDPGMGGNYPANYNDTIVFCPDLTLGTKVTLVFAINAGYLWQVDASDSVYVYDGPTTAAPLLGVHNSATDPNGITHQASWANTSGCLTVVFISNGTIEAAGWDANITCGNPAQPFEIHMNAFVNSETVNSLNPIDTGYVDVCLGDSILFVATPLFPNSFEATGFGYSQNSGNVNYTWEIAGVTAFPNNDSIWFVPPARQGYFVACKVTDIFPQSKRITAKARVSILPNFFGTGPVEDSICLGTSTSLLGGVTPSDTVGVEIPGGSFVLGGNFAGLTFLPDGSGAQYQAPVTISDFPSSATVTNLNDIQSICLNMEHTFLGDLEIAIECPNGTIVSLVNSYSPGFIPGGFGGGGTYLGDANDAGGAGVPGIGFDYCFSAVNATFGTMGDELMAGNTVPVSGFGFGGDAMNPDGIYLPDGNMSDLIGCPINGDWTIIVQDNLGIDDGYIFEWGIYFNGTLLPGSGTYQNVVTSDFWSANPTIVSGQLDTAIVVKPTTTGTFNYTYNVVDDFGCAYDTVVQLVVIPTPTIMNDTFACDLGLQVMNTFAFDGGIWSADTNIIFTDSSNLNPGVNSSVAGIYELYFTDNVCGITDTLTVNFVRNVYLEVFDTLVCENTPVAINIFNFPQNTSYIWNTGESGNSIIATQSGNYIVTASNVCSTTSDTVKISWKQCDINAPNVIVLSSTQGNDKFYLDYSGIKSFSCQIVNRWGNVVYDYNDPSKAWDGKSVTGVVCEEGTYYYILKAVFDNDEEVTKHGFIQLVY